MTSAHVGDSGSDHGNDTGIDALIEGDNAGLSAVMRMLRERVPLSEWRTEHRRALAAAVFRYGANARERAKGARLLGHLFGGSGSPLQEDDARDDRLADRLRADLADLVPYGAGMHLVAGSPGPGFGGGAV